MKKNSRTGGRNADSRDDIVGSTVARHLDGEDMLRVEVGLHVHTYGGMYDVSTLPKLPTDVAGLFARIAPRKRPGRPRKP